MEFQPSFAPSLLSLSDQIAVHARFRADDVALIDGGRRVTWAEYDATGNRIGNALRDAGIRKGDRIATLLANSLWAHELLLGTWRAGAVFAPLTPLLTADGLRTMLVDSGSRMLFASAQYVELATAAIETTDIRLITEGDAFDVLVSGVDSEAATIDTGADDLAVIIYSSGTTGTPKGIAHSHASRTAFAALLGAEFRFHYKSVALSSIPIHSNGAWLCWSPAKWFGGTTVILPEFTADAFIELVREHRPTHTFVVPAMCGALLRHPGIESAGLDCFEAAITAGAPMPDAMKNAMIRVTGGGLYELWGLTEGVGTIMSPADMPDRPGSVGRPILSCDIRLIDEGGNDITHSGVGEIVGYSAGLMSGYWNRPDASAETVWKDDAGTTFIRTGDIGEFDSEGFLTLRGRAKDMIISGGINVFPVDIENVLLGHELVRDAAVVGVEHEKWGETPVGFVIPNGTEPVDTDAVREWANARLAKHQRLHAVLIQEGDFPRNTLGKVLKNTLRDRYRTP